MLLEDLYARPRNYKNRKERSLLTDYVWKIGKVIGTILKIYGKY